MAKTASDLKIRTLALSLKKEERGQLLDFLLDSEVDRIVKKLRRNVRQQKLTPMDIERIVEKARKEFHEKSRR